VVKQSTNVVYKQRIELLSDLLLVGKFECPLKGDPDTFEMHWANLHNVPCLFALQNAVSSASCHTGNIQKLCAVDHMVVFATSNANAFGFNLEAKTAFIFPECGCDAGLHSWWSNLSCVVKRMCLVALWCLCWCA
jgi:hypothetical protein